MADGDGEAARSEGDGYEFSVGARTLLARRAGEAVSPATSTPAAPAAPSATTPAAMTPGRGVPGRGSLFPTQAATLQGAALQTTQAPSIETLENLLQAQLRLLHDRLDQMERRFDGAIIGAAQRWTVNPLFGAMLDQGMRPGTVTSKRSIGLIRLGSSGAWSISQGWIKYTPKVSSARWALIRELIKG